MPIIVVWLAKIVKLVHRVVLSLLSGSRIFSLFIHWKELEILVPGKDSQA